MNSPYSLAHAIEKGYVKGPTGPTREELLEALQNVVDGWDDWSREGKIEAAIEAARKLLR